MRRRAYGPTTTRARSPATTTPNPWAGPWTNCSGHHRLERGSERASRFSAARAANPSRALPRRSIWCCGRRRRWRCCGHWGDDATVAAIDASQDIAAADTLAWVEDEAVVVYSGPGGIRWERPVGGLVVARFRHHDSRHRMPLLHDYLMVSVKVLRADGKWGHLDSRRLLAHVVAADAFYNQGAGGGLRPARAGDRAAHAHAGAAAGDGDSRGAAGADRLVGHPAARHPPCCRSRRWRGTPPATGTRPRRGCAAG